MAKLVGALGTSHAPSIAFAHDAGHQDRPEWRAFFDAWTPVRQWLERIRADTLLVVYNDHLNTFQFNHYPTFALGMAKKMEDAWGVTGLSTQPGLTVTKMLPKAHSGELKALYIIGMRMLHIPKK